ncbi:MAG: hypothetical protein HDR72_00175 [Ruminococcaceae bacterium]|nr:hypothetical protein [Oscillospiraceae bacterium]
MKKICAAFLAAVAALSLCACDNADVNSENDTEIGGENYSSASSERTDTTSTEQSVPAVVDNPQNVRPENKQLTLLCTGDHLPKNIGCGTDEGYYSVQSNVAGGEYNCITYVDYATRQEVILCSDSSCKHDSERCTSVLPREWDWFCEMFFYKDHLYYLVSDLDNDGVFAAGGYSASGYSYEPINPTTPQLYRMNPDGTGRELVYTFGSNETVEHFAVGDGDGIWFVTKEPTIERDEETNITRYGSKNRAAVRLDLNERKIVEQIPLYYKDNIKKDFIGVAGSRMIFGGIAYPDGKSAQDYIDILAPSPVFGDTSGMDEYLEFMSTCEYAFFALDVTDKTMREIYRAGFDDISLNFTQIGEKLYIPTGEDYTSALALDLNTGNTEEFFVPEGYKLDGFVGESPVYITTDGEYKRYFIDPDTGKMINCILGGLNEVIAINSGRALVVYKTVGEELPEGGIMNPYDLYALISLDDLYNGRENFEPIDMLRRNV